MKFYVDYLDMNGDLSHVWTIADSKEEAISHVKHDYWDISEIINVHK